MTARSFVDANVLVYARDPRDARKQARAIEWLDVLWRERAGRTSMQVLSETYVVLTQKHRAPADEAWRRVERYFAWNPQPVDECVMRLAREIEQRYRLSWWDSTVVAAAQVQACGVLLTEDLQDGQIFGSLRVRNPFLHEVREAEAKYEGVPALKSLHRPRGRPRRVAAA